MSMIQLNKRQDKILEFISTRKSTSISQILEYIKKDFPKIAKITTNRDLLLLLQLNLIKKIGKGRSVTYISSPEYDLIKPIDVDEYFKIEIDKRQIKERFNHTIFTNFRNIFTKEEKSHLDNSTKKYQRNIKTISNSLLKKEFERLTIDLSWKSSQIEGNTYSLLETEQLIKAHQEAPQHSKEEAIMILNHKKTLDFIRNNVKQFKILTIPKIEKIHHLLTQGLGIKRNLRHRIVGITGTKYKPLDNEHQIREALKKMCTLVNKEKIPLTKAIATILFISYIQPFEDGNKRTGRLVSDAILLAFDLCPLSFRSVDKIEYKKAVILFYENNNISYFKKLFIEQYEFAIENYFSA